MSNIIGFLRRYQPSSHSITETETRPGDFMGEIVSVQRDPDHINGDHIKSPNAIKGLAETDAIAQANTQAWGAVDCDTLIVKKTISFDFMQLPSSAVKI